MLKMPCWAGGMAVVVVVVEVVVVVVVRGARVNNSGGEMWVMIGPT